MPNLLLFRIWLSWVVFLEKKYRQKSTSFLRAINTEGRRAGSYLILKTFFCSYFQCGTCLACRCSILSEFRTACLSGSGICSTVRSLCLDSNTVPETLVLAPSSLSSTALIQWIVKTNRVFNSRRRRFLKPSCQGDSTVGPQFSSFLTGYKQAQPYFSLHFDIWMNTLWTILGVNNQQRMRSLLTSLFTGSHDCVDDQERNPLQALIISD